MNQPLLRSPFVNVFLFSLFWALWIFVTKLGFNAGAQTVPFIVQSTIVAIIVLAAYVLPRKLDEIMNLPRTILIGILIASAVHYGLGGFFSYAGIALTSAVNAGFLMQFATVTTAILAWVVLKERITTIRVFMVVLIMVGTFFLITKGRFSAPHAGEILLLLACLSWSTGNILIRKFLKGSDVSADTVTFFRPLAGLPIFLVFILLAPVYPSAMQSMFGADILDVRAGWHVLLSGLCLVLLWLFLNRTLKIATASYMTMMSSLTPVFVALLSILFLDEGLALVQVFGAVLIVLSSFVTHFSNVSED